MWIIWLVFSEKKKKKNASAAVEIGALRVKSGPQKCCIQKKKKKKKKKMYGLYIKQKCIDYIYKNEMVIFLYNIYFCWLFC